MGALTRAGRRFRFGRRRRRWSWRVGDLESVFSDPVLDLGHRHVEAKADCVGSCRKGFRVALELFWPDDLT